MFSSLASDSGDICRKLDILLVRKFIDSGYLFPSSKHSFDPALGCCGNPQGIFFFKSELPLLSFTLKDKSCHGATVKNQVSLSLSL